MTRLRTVLALLAGLLLACGDPPDPQRYRLAGSGDHWDVSGSDPVFEDLEPRYPEFFEVVLDPQARADLDMRPLREDLERTPVDRRNFDALNSVAIAYYELNYRAQTRKGGSGYFDDSFRAAKLLALPWKAYGLTESDAFRSAILDFFEDAASGEKLLTHQTAPRLAPIIASLEDKELDEGRRRRIRDLVERIEAGTPPQAG